MQRSLVERNATRGVYPSAARASSRLVPLMAAASNSRTRRAERRAPGCRPRAVSAEGGGFLSPQYVPTPWGILRSTQHQPSVCWMTATASQPSPPSALSSASPALASESCRVGRRMGTSLYRHIPPPSVAEPVLISWGAIALPRVNYRDGTQGTHDGARTACCSVVPTSSRCGSSIRSVFASASRARDPSCDLPFQEDG